jgi:hypothetical protein
MSRCVMISSDVCEKLESCRQSPDGKAPWTCFLKPIAGKTDPAFVAMQQQMQMQGGGPGGPPPMMMPPPPNGGQPPKKGLVGRLKSMLP